MVSDAKLAVLMENAHHVIKDLPCLKMASVNNVWTVAASVAQMLYINARADAYKDHTEMNKSASHAHRLACHVNPKTSAPNAFQVMIWSREFAESGVQTGIVSIVLATAMFANNALQAIWW